MFSNLKRTTTLMLLASAAGSVLAAPAPVYDLSGSSSRSTASSSAGSSETEIQRLERLVETRSRLQLRMQQQIDEMSLEINSLRGQIERNTHDMQQMLQRQRELFVELDKVRGEIKNSAPSAQSSDATPGTETDGVYSNNASEQKAYQDAVDLILKKRDYNGAIAAFQKFQKDYPDSAFTANSHYWLGQLYYAKKQDKDAAKSFAAVASYKDSSKRADSLVKLGNIAKRNNNMEQARKFYQQVVDEYPNSSSAKVAQQNLK